MIIGDLAGFFPTFPGLKELTELYKELNLEADRFKRAAGLACVEWCKKCCNPEKAQIEACVFECLPLAVPSGRGERRNPFFKEFPQTRREISVRCITPMILAGRLRMQTPRPRSGQTRNWPGG